MIYTSRDQLYTHMHNDLYNVVCLPGHVAILQWMLHHSLVNGDEADDFGATPIHDAAEQGQLDSLHVFYEHSVNMNIPDCDGLTPRCALYSVHSGPISG